MKQYNITWYQKVEDIVEADSIEAAEKTATSFVALKNKRDQSPTPLSALLFSIEEVDESTEAERARPV